MEVSIWSSHPFNFRIFHEINYTAIGVPHGLETPIYEILRVNPLIFLISFPYSKMQHQCTWLQPRQLAISIYIYNIVGYNI